MNILKLIAQLTLDGRGFKAGIREAQSIGKGFANNLAGSIKGELAAVFGAGALVAFAKNALSSTAALKDMAEQSRMTTTEVQEMTAAAANASLEWNDVAAAERQFSQRRREAAEGNERLRESFAALGMDLNDLQNPQLRFIDFLERANKAMENMTPEQKARASVELFDTLGKMGPKLEGFLKELQNSKGITIVSPEDIQRIDQAEKKVESLARTIRGRFAIFTADTMEGGNWMQKFGPGGVFRFWKAMLSGKGQNEDGFMPEGRVGYDKPIGPQRPGGSPLFVDERAQKLSEDTLKEQRKLEEAIYALELKRAGTAEKRAMQEQRIKDLTENVLGFMGNETPEARMEELKARQELAQALAGMDTSSRGPDVSSLTRVGQFEGRSFMNAPDSPQIRTAKEILGVNKVMKEKLTSIDAKVDKGGSLTGGL